MANNPEGLSSLQISTGLLEVANELSAYKYSAWRAYEIKGSRHKRAYWLDNPKRPNLGMVSNIERYRDGRYANLVWAAKFVIFDEDQSPHSTVVDREDLTTVRTEFDLDFLDAFMTYYEKIKGERPEKWNAGLGKEATAIAIRSLRSASYRTLADFSVHDL